MLVIDNPLASKHPLTSKSRILFNVNFALYYTKKLKLVGMDTITLLCINILRAFPLIASICIPICVILSCLWLLSTNLWMISASLFNENSFQFVPTEVEKVGISYHITKIPTCCSLYSCWNEFLSNKQVEIIHKLVKIIPRQLECI